MLLLRCLVVSLSCLWEVRIGDVRLVAVLLQTQDIVCDSFYAGAQRLEGACYMCVLGGWREVERDGALALEERELDVIC